MLTTQEDPTGLSRQKRRRLIVGAAIRSALAATVIVVLYYLLPLDGGRDIGTGIRLLIGLLVFASLITWQLRAIVGARYPGVRAAEALGLLLPLFLVVFASTYYLMAQASAASFTESLTRTDSLYFTITTFATVGFGDIDLRPKPPASLSWSR